LLTSQRSRSAARGMYQRSIEPTRIAKVGGAGFKPMDSSLRKSALICGRCRPTGFARNVTNAGRARFFVATNITSPIEHLRRHVASIRVRHFLFFSVLLSIGPIWLPRRTAMRMKIRLALTFTPFETALPRASYREIQC
jgi:hypothetical protein